VSLFSSLQVSASGLSAQRTRSEMLVENMANAETTRTPGGGPYRRKEASPFSAVFQNELGTGVMVSEVVQDTRDPDLRYQPGHPDANADGYVAYPKMNPAEEMVDLLNASRSYQANVSAISAVKDMLNHSLDILK